jgi:hypothetical protein
LAIFRLTINGVIQSLFDFCVLACLLSWNRVDRSHRTLKRCAWNEDDENFS